MKTKIVLLALFAAFTCFSNSGTAQVDLVPGINYSYNPPGANGIIQIVNMDVCNNGASSAGSFDVALYIYNTGTHNAYVVGDTMLSGINGNSCITINNWNVNINNTPGVPAGTYQPGEWVNSKHMVTETDTTNNAGLFSGTWTYSPDGINEISALAKSISVYPNPGNGNYELGIRNGGALTSSSNNNSSSNYESKDKINVEVYTVLGEKVYSNSFNISQRDPFGQNSIFSIDLKSQPNGVYFYKVLAQDGTFITSGKLIKQ
ncbi:MAG TPA: T9SS type A sorting domain-containing protein [Bacteroidia bacterium]|jgi:hypothetical protein|nr:T9SS type A sorting domain-containing protein [Bacteroidia bacterium]